MHPKFIRLIAITGLVAVSIMGPLAATSADAKMRSWGAGRHAHNICYDFTPDDGRDDCARGVFLHEPVVE